MLAERMVIWFFWGQDYLGTLTSMAAVIAGLVLANGVGPLALRIAVAAELIVGLLLSGTLFAASGDQSPRT